MTKVYYDKDADLKLLAGKTIAIIGYGNQGRAQALNLKDSGCKVIIGGIHDETLKQAENDGFGTCSVAEAAKRADIIMLLIPDEVMGEVYRKEIEPGLKPGKAVCFASGYTVAFGEIKPGAGIDIIMVAPRMIGAGVRQRYVDGTGFPSFIGVHQDATGNALKITLAVAKGIGSTKSGALEVTFADEAAMDLFTEQAYAPAGAALFYTAVKTLVDAGFPPEAAMVELYLSGEHAYCQQKTVEMGIPDQLLLHSHTSQYGQMTRAARFDNSEIAKAMQKALKEIQSGAFAKEWTAEQAAGLPTFNKMKKQIRENKMAEWENQARKAFHMEINK